MALSPVQKHALLNSTARVNIADGSIRSGKTIWQIVRWATFVATAPPGELMIAGKTMHSVYRNVIAPIEYLPDLAWLRPHIKFRLGGGVGTMLGKRVHIIGANDEKAEGTIRGMTLAGAAIDEITMLPESFFKQTLGRMSVAGAQLFGTTNPDSENHWLNKKYLKRIGTELEDWTRFKFRLDDNPSLPDAYKESIKREYTGLWYDRFILGKWVAAEGAIFSSFNRAQHVVDHYDLPDAKLALSIGIDYGTTNASSALALYLGTDDRLYLTDEWRIDQENRIAPLTDSELSASLRDWYRLPLHPTHSHNPTQIYVDPSATSFRTQLNRDGIRNRPALNNVNDGIKLMASLLAADRLRISTRCTGLLEEITGYAWDTKAKDRGEDIPVKQDDHSVDAARYAIYSSQSWWRRHIPNL